MLDWVTFAPIVGRLLEHGTLGLVALIATLFAWHKDREAADMAKQLSQQIQEHAAAKEEAITELWERLHATEIEHARRYRHLASELAGVIDSIWESGPERPALVAVDSEESNEQGNQESD